MPSPEAECIICSPEPCTCVGKRAKPKVAKPVSAMPQALGPTRQATLPVALPPAVQLAEAPKRKSQPVLEEVVSENDREFRRAITLLARYRLIGYRYVIENRNAFDLKPWEVEAMRWRLIYAERLRLTK